LESSQVGTVSNLKLGPDCTTFPVNNIVGAREPCWEGKQNKVLDACNGFGSSSVVLGRVLEGMVTGGEIGDTSSGWGVTGLRMFLVALAREYLGEGGTISFRVKSNRSGEDSPPLVMDAIKSGTEEENLNLSSGHLLAVPGEMGRLIGAINSTLMESRLSEVDGRVACLSNNLMNPGTKYSEVLGTGFLNSKWTYCTFK